MPRPIPQNGIAWQVKPGVQRRGGRCSRRPTPPLRPSSRPQNQFRRSCSTASDLRSTVVEPDPPAGGPRSPANCPRRSANELANTLEVRRSPAGLRGLGGRTVSRDAWAVNTPGRNHRRRIRPGPGRRVLLPLLPRSRHRVVTSLGIAAVITYALHTVLLAARSARWRSTLPALPAPIVAIGITADSFRDLLRADPGRVPRWAAACGPRWRPAGGEPGRRS